MGMLNPNTKWLRDAKWGLFAHYLVHMPSAPIPEDMTAEKWNRKVSLFRVKDLADQLSEVGASYFFITIGQAGDYCCSPNQTYERLLHPPEGHLSERDLVADLAAELTPRGIRTCVYHTARYKEPKHREAWYEVITEWSKRWGNSVSAWWIDGGYQLEPDVYQRATEAYKSGNPEALVAYNSLPVGWNRDQLLPATEYEDYLAGECDYFLPTSGIRVFDGKAYYRGPNISGVQLHFLNFLGAWWGTGVPRFSKNLVVSWTQHVNAHGGTVTWDLPVRDDGIIAEPYMEQLRSLGSEMRAG